MQKTTTESGLRHKQWFIGLRMTINENRQSGQNQHFIVVKSGEF
jgi:hypothetical protein